MLLMYVCDMQEPVFLNCIMILLFIENVFLDHFRNHCIRLCSLFLIVEYHHLQQVISFGSLLFSQKCTLDDSRNSCIRIFSRNCFFFGNYQHRWKYFENTRFSKNVIVMDFFENYHNDNFFENACLRKSFTCDQIFEITTKSFFAIILNEYFSKIISFGMFSINLYRKHTLKIFRKIPTLQVCENVLICLFLENFGTCDIFSKLCLYLHVFFDKVIYVRFREHCNFENMLCEIMDFYQCIMWCYLW